MVIELWIVLGLAQLALLALIAAAVCGWRWRAAAAQNSTLEVEIEAARAAVEAGTKLLGQVKSAQTWTDMLDEHIAEIGDGESELDRLRLTVLRHERDGTEIDLSKFGDSDEIDKLRAQIVSLQLQLEHEAQTPSDREGDLKSLVQQFTHDSREMLSCIQNLEAECNGLRAQLAEATRDAA